MRYHVKMDKLLQKEAKVTKVPDDTYGGREREREGERRRERVVSDNKSCQEKLETNIRQS